MTNEYTTGALSSLTSKNDYIFTYLALQHEGFDLNYPGQTHLNFKTFKVQLRLLTHSAPACDRNPKMLISQVALAWAVIGTRYQESDMDVLNR